MKLKYSSLLLSIIITAFSFQNSFGQKSDKTIERQFQMWTQYNLMGRFADKWSLYFDGVDRFNGFFKSENIIFLRPAIVYDLNENSSLYLGYAYAPEFPEEDVKVIVPEHRIWEQFLIKHKSGKFSFQHRYRLEERFIQKHSETELLNSYTYTWRFRYKLSIQYPLIHFGESSLSALLSDELITSFGKNVVVSYFNQNRLLIGLSFALNKSLSASLGYQNVFRSTSKPGAYVNINTVSININQKIDFRKRNPPHEK